MAQLLRCKLCGYITVRCGMHNHLKAKHPDQYIGKPFDEITIVIGKVVRPWRDIKKEIDEAKQSEAKE